jgi:hypothetical protein
MAMVLYWRLRNAQAARKMISPISFIFGVPVGRFITFLIRKSANITVITPAAGTIQNIFGNSDIFPFL